MARSVAILLLLVLGVWAQTPDQNATIAKIYNDNCVACHTVKGLSLQKLFFRYLLKYSSEISVKTALFDYLKNPNPLTSVLSAEDRRRHNIKHKTNLSDEQLRRVIDLYWEKYKVFGRLK